MMRADRRVVVSHVGSLVRPPAMIPYLEKIRDKKPYDEAAFEKCLADSVTQVVLLQAEAGITGDPERLIEDPGLNARYTLIVDKVNRGLARFESVKYFTLLARDFSEAEGELTPTLKKKRRVIAQNFQDVIEEMYAAHKRR